MNNKLTGGIHPAVAAVWAAVVAAVHILPTFPILGTGGTFSVSSVLIPLSGIFFGPIAGALCSAAGCFLGNLIAPYTAWVGLGTFIIGTTTAFTTGCIAWGKWPPLAVNSGGNIIINGGILVYIVGTILWFTQEIGRSIIIYPLVYYGLGFISMIAGIILAPRFFSGSKRLLKFPAIWLCAFGGLVGGATVGNFFSLVLYKLPKEFWATLIIISPVERAVFATGAMLIGAPLMSGLNKIGIFVGPQNEEELTEDSEQEVYD
jgi:uncharacterized membrane protein